MTLTASSRFEDPRSFRGAGLDPDGRGPGEHVFAFRTLGREWSFPRVADRFLPPFSTDGHCRWIAFASLRRTCYLLRKWIGYSAARSGRGLLTFDRP